MHTPLKIKKSCYDILEDPKFAVRDSKGINVLLIREQDGQRRFVKIDLRSKELFESEYYYLHSNDIVYVEPGKGKIASADAVYRILPIVLSGLSTIALFLRLGGTF